MCRSKNKGKGCVYIVGAGCGKADLITLRGLNCLKECEVVIYDDLIDVRLLDYVMPGTEKIYVGKRRGRHSVSQEEICKLLIEKALQGKNVVRLKGGDPFVFGRGGEEMLELKKRGIDCEEVPGITSAIAIPAEAGIPVTYRKISRSVHIITGHTAEDKAAEDFGVLAKLKGTLVFLMGLDKLEEITDALIAEGKDWNTPAAVISGGNAVNPVILRGTLKDISEKTKKKSVQSPVVIVIGKVAAMDLQNYHYMAAR